MSTLARALTAAPIGASLHMPMNTRAQAVLAPIHLHPSDDVAVVGTDTPAGTPLTVDAIRVVTTSDVPSGHKVALRAIAAAEPVRKYGEVIGYATVAIAPGDHVHVHNLGLRAGRAAATSCRSRGPRRRVPSPTARSRGSAAATARSARAT